MQSLHKLVAIVTSASGIETWQCALLSVERGLLALDVPGLQ